MNQTLRHLIVMTRLGGSRAEIQAPDTRIMIGRIIPALTGTAAINRLMPQEVVRLVPAVAGGLFTETRMIRWAKD